MSASNMARSGPRGSSMLFSAVAALSGAQQALLTEIAKHREQVTVSELADAMNLHPNSIRATLDSLQSVRLVGREQLRTPGRGRPSWGYFTMAPAQESFMTHQLTDLTSIFCDEIRRYCDDPAATAVDIGKKWGDRVLRGYTPLMSENPDTEPMENIVGHVRMFFTSLGYAATIQDSDAHVVELRSCPFMDDAGRVDPLMCELHRGMCDQALGVTTGQRVEAQLVPLAGPEVCEVRVIDARGEK